MTNPDDSIDGLGLTFTDLTGVNAASIAQFRLTKKVGARLDEIQTNELRPAFVVEMHGIADAIVASANQARDAFDAIARA